MTSRKIEASSANKDCIGCGKEKEHLDNTATMLCKTCESIVDLLQNSPETLDHLVQLADVQLDAQRAEHEEQELPDVLDGVRYRTTDRERNTWYVSVSELDGHPVEIFASTAFDRDQHLQSRISNLTTITRLISLILRHIFIGERLTLEKTLTQLKRSSRQPNDLPEMLGKILSNYEAKRMNNEVTDSTIP